jgi:hypothetical protein
MKVKAANAGRWGGKKRLLGGEATMASDLAETTLDTGETMLLNEWAGGYLTLDEVSGSAYKVVSNTIAGVVTVESDYTMKTDYASGSDEGWALYLLNDSKEVSVEIGDGDDDASAYFSLSVYVDGVFVRRYPNLSLNSTNKYYYKNLINDDSSNYQIEIESIWAGADLPANKPANYYSVSDTIATTVLTAQIHHTTINSPTSANPTVALGTLTSTMKWRDTITCTIGTSPAFTVSSAIFGALTTAGSIGTEFVPDTPYLPPFTITDGATPLATADTVTILYDPFIPDELIGETLIPDYVNNRRTTFRITDNTVETITASSDISVIATAGEAFMVISPTPLGGGYDGDAPTDANFTDLFDPVTSPILSLFSQNKGLIKVATPGKASSTVDKEALSFVELNNMQYRVEIPTNKTTEVSADEYINDTVGRNDFGVTTWPSWGYREALVAKNYNGYHKAAAGINVALPKVLKLDVGEDVPINEEYTNPLGLNIVKKVKGNYILWGDRTIALDPAWKWKHQRELMTHYERQLIESMDWIIFAINDVATEKQALFTLREFFRLEWQKSALRGDKFEDAASIKIDSENNTDVTRASGDMYADIELVLADTVERFIMRIGKAGLSEG